MGKELINWENGRWIGQTLEVENGVCAVPSTPEGGLEYNDEVKAATVMKELEEVEAQWLAWEKSEFDSVHQEGKTA